MSQRVEEEKVAFRAKINGRPLDQTSGPTDPRCTHAPGPNHFVLHELRRLECEKLPKICTWPTSRCRRAWNRATGKSTLTPAVSGRCRPCPTWSPRLRS